MTDTISPFQHAIETLDLEKIAEKLINADTANFTEINDLWQPKTKGEQLLGFLVAREKSRFVNDSGVTANWYGFAALNPRTGKAEPKRVLGTSILERALGTLEIGTMVELTYEGEEAAPRGTVKLFRVRVQA